MKTLVIVESPAKAKTIGKYLGNDYVVLPTIGHIRELPKKDAIDPNNNYEMTYIISPGKEDAIKKITASAKTCDEIILATDPDREGEAIAWHVADILETKHQKKIKGKNIKRAVFYEISKEAVEKAVQSPGEIAMDMVLSQETRRALDRHFGFTLSPLLWRLFPSNNHSAGRVQSPAIKIIIDKERERLKFIQSQYHSITATLDINKNKFESTLISSSDQKIATGNDFDKKTGDLKSKGLIHLTKKSAEEFISKLDDDKWVVSDVQEKPYSKSPSPPFITSTLQQAGISKLRVGAQRIMSISQKLYENGYITYMRTDSINLSSEALNASRSEISNLYGKDYLPENPIMYKSKVKNAQEAHEAIRPAGSKFIHPDTLKAKLDKQEYELYKLIWSRTIGCQMKSAKLLTTNVKINNNDFVFQSKGKTVQFDGYLKVYQDSSKDGDEAILPSLEKNQSLNFNKVELKEHLTKPIPRYTEASLVKELETLGIGRPSTYASIISTIINRGYVTRLKGTLIPTFTGFAVVKFLEKYFEQLINLKFTAEMEDDLDAISRSDKDHLLFLKTFYSGSKEQKGLDQLLDQKFNKDESKKIMTLTADKQDDIVLKIGSYGTYLERGEYKTNLPDEFGPENISYEIANEMLKLKLKDDECVGKMDGEEIVLKTGRFGSYLKCGDKTKGFPPGITPENLDEEMAVKIMSLPLIIGKDGEDDIKIDIGKFGPYIRCGKQTQSIPSSDNLFELNDTRAIEILNSKQSSGKVLGKDKKSEKEIEIKRGRFGYYVTDGKINVSLKNGDQDTITLDEAIEKIETKKMKA